MIAAEQRECEEPGIGANIGYGIGNGMGKGLGVLSIAVGGIALGATLTSPDPAPEPGRY
jgi:hypothetical protein